MKWNGIEIEKIENEIEIPNSYTVPLANIDLPLVTKLAKQDFAYIYIYLYIYIYIYIYKSTKLTVETNNF